jgi:hypothetical protein
MHAFNDGCRIMDTTVRAGMRRKFVEIVRLNIFLYARSGAYSTVTYKVVITHAQTIGFLIKFD